MINQQSTRYTLPDEDKPAWLFYAQSFYRLMVYAAMIAVSSAVVLMLAYAAASFVGYP